MERREMSENEPGLGHSTSDNHFLLQSLVVLLVVHSSFRVLQDGCRVVLLLVVVVRLVVMVLVTALLVLLFGLPVVLLVFVFLHLRHRRFFVVLE